MATGNENFWLNVSRYPRYLITFIFGTFYVIYDWIKPLAKERPLFLGLVVTFMIALFMFMYFTLEAMLGISAVQLA
ncbi:DUF751 family protein [Geitlerinema sp. P-1104]|uniref:DUF751 family protein n=1 Tax=Geitlerinema sp. P-1104 TaxID=2546230 RepID=UPI00147729F2|nr:DUF751 family protein [Geitlerinema sp. P-1104]NMG58888.1 DUF751 family protein [Geitlerinema sp. P-1104]